MTFLIFVAAFVVIACVALPLGVLAVFAVARDAETGVEAPREEPRKKAVTPKSPLTSGRGETVIS